MTDEVLEAARDLVFAEKEDSNWRGPWADVAYDDIDSEEFEYETEERDPDTGRWSQYCYTVFRHKESGRFFGFEWQSGLTESQEDDGPFGRDDVAECFRHEETKVVVSWSSEK